MEKSKEKLNLVNMSAYLHEQLFEDIKEFQESAKPRTGFENLDSLTSMYPGMYLLGAISGLGKTTFVSQMADQMAADGNHILFFSLEQKKIEIATKSIARHLNLNEKETKMSAVDIRARTDVNNISDNLKDAIDNYSQYAGRINIVEGSLDVNIELIENTVDQFIKNNKVTPIVVIDYLQLIQPMQGERMTTKDNVDRNIRKLKQLQLKHNLILIVISSLNRQNYMNIIDFESFKETGGIEYTADVIWGLQFSILRDPEFDNYNITQKREAIQKAKEKTPREVELTSIKNRNGVASYSALFQYYPEKEYFKGIPHRMR